MACVVGRHKKTLKFFFYCSDYCCICVLYFLVGTPTPPRARHDDNDATRSTHQARYPIFVVCFCVSGFVVDTFFPSRTIGGSVLRCDLGLDSDDMFVSE